MDIWNECCVKINEMYKENLNLRESIGRLENKQIQAQNVINELEMLKVAQKTIINALNSAVIKQREMIDKLKAVEDAHKQLIASQRNYINVLTKEIKDLKEENDSLTDFIDDTQ
ncbi:MAG: hypothetical protein ACLRPZ_16450 [Coprococcus sp.]